MKGMIDPKSFKSNFAHLSDVYFTGGQPFRGRELGSVKYRNTESSSRNYSIQNGEGLITTEYHKARASTNYSFYVVRFLPDSVATLIALYLVYIRPFAKMLYRNALSPEPKTNTVTIKTVSRSVSKKAGQRQAKKKTSVRIGRTAKVVKDEDEMLDRGYIYPYLPRKTAGFPPLTLVFTHKQKLVDIKIPVLLRPFTRYFSSESKLFH